ncbi:hypothetical protein CEXT_549261 [Caerostris extrusa]|uniref:Uncharacterized protein n=1 Tax=Caerostris extrusa TaxID=172846 RepID=A0AAV4V4S0_CAEEX|nr:hypothetical protein CEXT_549261 [Caerostris extrusa]
MNCQEEEYDTIEQAAKCIRCGTFFSRRKLGSEMFALLRRYVRSVETRRLNSLREHRQILLHILYPFYSLIVQFHCRKTFRFLDMSHPEKCSSIRPFSVSDIVCPKSSKCPKQPRHRLHQRSVLWRRLRDWD